MIFSAKTESRAGIVCLGASAGGLKAFTTLLSHLPGELGYSFVIVNHQEKDARPLLLQILPRYTDMRIELVADGCSVAPNRVYVIPANWKVRISDGAFGLTPRVKARGWPDIISIFLNSLADDQRAKAIAVILSGYGPDGADALAHIKNLGGVVFAQSFESATVPEMPRCAVGTGCVDHLLAPEGIAFKLAAMAKESWQ